jgi:hypothetical protein
MNPRLLVFMAAFIFAAGFPPSAVAVAPVDGSDPIVGRWSWFNGGIKDFHADGTVSPGGTWRCIDPNLTPREYRVVWGNKWVDKLRLLKDNRLLRGHNQGGVDVWAHRFHP